MKPLSPDTSPEAQQVQFDLLRRTPVWKRLALTCELIQASRKLMLSDLRHRYPQASEGELRRKLIARLLTRDEVIRVYGFDPEEEAC
ncbi:MAG: hypothetical protein QOJ02_3887 [Acidobacteriota bacterium]|jgi:hypothetical protein|nr:hypothetical protein [Acidobacteriota bacterium]